jgi:predicted permease
MNRKRLEDEMERDFREHIERETEDNIARGMSPEEARYAAHRKFGNVARLKEETRYVWTWRWADELSQDLRYAFRTLRKNPAFAAVAVLSLALGIGANTAIFSLIDSLLLRPLPVPHPEELVTLDLQTGADRAQGSMTYPIFDEARSRNKVLAQTFAWDNHDFQTSVGGDTVHVHGVLASGDYFTGLDVPAAAGRTFTLEDDQSGGGPSGPVAVISDAFWARQFQRNPSAIGHAITLDKVPFTIIGVMPRGFFGAEPGKAPDIWAPLNLAHQIGDERCIASRSCWFLSVMGRLKPGLTMSAAAAQFRVISPESMKATLPPDWGGEGRKRFLRMQLRPNPGATGSSFLRRRFSNPLEILMILVGVVLLIACANMANLLIARSASRHRETAVRLAIGAGRWRLIRQLLTESVLISVLGAALGLAFAEWSVRLLVGFLEVRSSPIALDLNPDWRVLVFTASAAILTGLLFGLFPALQATRLGINMGLKKRAQNVMGAPDRFGVGRVLLGGQVALSVLLVAGSGLFAGSLVNLWTINPGFNPRNLMLIGIDTDKRPEKGAALAAIYTRLLERLSSFPGVKSASLLLITPTSNFEWDDDVSIPGGPEIPPALRDTMVNLVGPRYFQTMQTPLLTGREFTSQDSATAEKVGIISERAARAWFGGRSPVGEHIQFQKSVIRIIAVAADAKYLDLRQPDPLALYLCYLQNEGPGSLSFIVRADAGFSSIYPAFRAAVKQVAPGTPVDEVKTMEEQVSESLGRERLMASLSIFFGVLALLLTCIGLYGILAYSVARRQAEIGLRVAVGASRGNVIWLILRETLWHVVAGAGVGVAAVLGTSRFVASFLYGVKPNDPWTLAFAVAALGAVTLGAAWMPARRAARLDPMVALRDE